MKAIFGDAAKIELVETIDWYEVQQKGLGKRFAQALDLTKKRICYSLKSALRLLTE